MGPHERLGTDLDLIAQTHGLSARDRTELACIVAGAIPGNRDRPLFLLALRLFSNGNTDLLSMMMPAASGLRRIDTALLDFLITVALESAEAVSGLVDAFDAALCTSDPARAFTPTLAAVLHAYRVRVLPEARHRNVFAAVRRYLVGLRPEDPWPRDGDAPRFWVAEGRRDFLTRYVSALHALADYAEAARLAASWRETVTLDVADVIAASGPEEEQLVTAEDSLAAERLATSFALLDEAPIKLLLAHEREAINELGEHAALVLRWPGDVQAALTFGPVQAAITQALRRTSGCVDITTLIDKGPSRQDLLDRIDDLDASLSACLHLIHQSITTASETGSTRSSLSAEDTRRIAAMKRRHGFREHSVDSRNAILTELIEPVLLLVRLLERYRRAWDRLGPEGGAALEHAHREMFRQKFSMLYGEVQKE
jgi:hypothetical protein